MGVTAPKVGAIRTTANWKPFSVVSPRFGQNDPVWVTTPWGNDPLLWEDHWYKPEGCSRLAKTSVTPTGFTTPSSGPRPHGVTTHYFGNITGATLRADLDSERVPAVQPERPPVKSRPTQFGNSDDAPGRRSAANGRLGVRLSCVVLFCGAILTKRPAAAAAAASTHWVGFSFVLSSNFIFKVSNSLPLLFRHGQNTDTFDFLFRNFNGKAV